ncbi:MAG: response regulator [Chitinivibrionia bacterium]|nr:response regulator [Chitinivibrionia bacterium]
MKPMRILVVDDEIEFVTTLVERLELRSIEAEGVTRGSEALQRIAEKPFDIVLLDVKMPGIGGMEVIRKIKQEHPEMHVILLTGHGSAEAVEEARLAGAFEFLMKPVNIDELLRIFRLASSD